MHSPTRTPFWNGVILTAILASSLAVAGPIGCVTEAHVRDEIDEANHCAAPGDCVNVGSHCPFGCYVLVNAGEAERIEELIQDYYDSHGGEQCMYDCIAVSGFDCQAQRCVTLEATDL
jgi:hypothetical protein